MKDFLGARTYVALGGALVAGLTLALGLTFGLRGGEVFSQNTAVGDQATFTLPTPLPTPPPAVATFDGRAVQPVDWTLHKVKDETQMHRVAKEEKSGLSLYQDTKGATWIKAAPNQYLSVQQAR